MDGGTPPHGICVSADRGGIAAGRDVHVQCSLRPCPACEQRWINGDARICAHCRRAARSARLQRDAIAALLGFCVCLLIWLELASLAGCDRSLGLIITGAAATFGAGAWAWLHATLWSKAPVMHHWRAFRDGLVRGIMRFPIRRVPDSEWEKPMEHDEADAARLIAEAAKLMAEAGRANAQARWYPVIVIGGVFAASLILVKFVL